MKNAAWIAMEIQSTNQSPVIPNIHAKKKVSDALSEKILPKMFMKQPAYQKPLQENIGTPMKRTVLLRRLWK
jgi:hypothetical protein